MTFAHVYNECKNEDDTSEDADAVGLASVALT